MTPKSKEDIDWRNQNLGRLLLNTFRFTEESILQELHNANYTDIRLVHLNVLRQLDYDGTRLTELADRAGITKQAMLYLVNEVEKMGYIERKADPEDGRAKTVCFSRKGKKLLERCKEIILEQERYLEKHIGKADFNTVRKALQKLARLHDDAQVSSPDTLAEKNKKGNTIVKSAGRPPKVFQGSGSLRDKAMKR